MQQIEDIISIQNEAPNNMHNNQDCLGMTPLHILACSSKHDLELCQFIVAIYPNSLITEDKWGCPPILYAIWGGAAQEIVQFLIGSQKSTFPNHILDWDGMVETLCRAGASLDIVKRLLDIQQESFSGQQIDWQKAARELAIHFLVGCHFYGGDEDWMGGFFDEWGSMMEALGAPLAYQELVQYLLGVQQLFFPNQNDPPNLQKMCEDLVKPHGWWRSGPRSGGAANSMMTFRFLVKCNIGARVNAIGVRKWRMEIKTLVERTSSIDVMNLTAHTFETIHSKLARYEHEYYQLKDAAFFLELALWKSKIDESTMQNQGLGQNEQMEDDTADTRMQCRINCGSVIIIPNVLPYLIAGV